MTELDLFPEMLEFLQEYLRIDTSHPAPDYDGAISFLRKRAKADGLACQTWTLASGLPMLILTVPGSNQSLPSLVLNHHMDTVGVPNPDMWDAPPYAGQILNDVLIGRGVQDMKGVGAIHYFALKSIAAKKPRRTVHLFAVPDEERGGSKGTAELIVSDDFKKLNIGFVLDEGRTCEDAILIKVDERKPLQIRLVAHGELAHGSLLTANNPVHTLVQCLEKIVALHKENQEKVGDKEAGELLSTNVTSLMAGIVGSDGNAGVNVVPHLADATIDVRVPPSMTIQSAKEVIYRILKAYPLVECNILAEVNERNASTSIKSNLYESLVASIRDMGLQVRPHISEGASDLRFYIERGIQGLGLSPYLVVDNIHGTNESLPISELRRGLAIFQNILNDFVCD